MDVLLAKIFATALAFSQVATTPDSVKTAFDPVQDQQQVVSLLRAGCAQMRKAFDIEDLNVDDLIATAMDDPEAVSGGYAAFRGINIKDLHVAYRQFCKNETVADSPVDLTEVIEFYNRTLTDLPDHTKLKGMRLPGTSVVLDLKGQRFAEVFEHDHRRVWVPLSDVPQQVQQAFVAAEDKRFYQHHGIDERALIRAFIGNLAQSGRPQGGSTITQQVVKNLLVGEDVTYERKIREMILASRVEHTLTKPEILELYVNSVFLGRGTWGIEMASRGYFGKSTQTLSLGEAAMLAALTKGPSYFNPDRHPERVKERLNYVLGRMVEDGMITAEDAKAVTGLPQLVAYERPRRDTGFHFVDHVARELKSMAGLDGLTADSYVVHSTINPALQRATESALQEGLARFEMDSGRVEFQGAEANLAEAIRRIEAERSATDKPTIDKPTTDKPAAPDKPPTDKPVAGGKQPAAKSAAVKADPKPDVKPAWQQALESARLPLYDVHWPAAVIIEKAGRGGDSFRVGLADGRVLPLSNLRGSAGRNLKLYDVVLVRVVEAKGRSARADLRVRPQVQGAAVVLENKTGRILAMTGGFSYPLSQLNRVTQSQRQPGSSLKPLTYLAALQKGLQPNTLVRDEAITLPPINGSMRERDYWTPKNYDGGSSGVITLRRALEHSKNLATVNLLDGGIDQTPSLSLDRVCALGLETQIYKDCARYYPFVLGAQPVRPIDLAAFYATIANEGLRPAPYAIDSVERAGTVVYQRKPALTEIASADAASFYQLKSMMQGVLRRGTAASIAGLAPYVAGKTGTTDGENDVWFVGFSNEVTVAVWVGYDNADGKRRTLGGGQTGGSLAVPIFEPIMQAVWSLQAPRTLLAQPTAAARKLLVASRTDAETGEEDPNGRSVEYLRRDGYGRAVDSRYALVSRDEVYSAREDAYNPNQPFAPWGAPQQPPGSPRSTPSAGGFFGLFQRRDDEQQRWQQQQQLQQQQRQQQWQQQQQQQRRPAYPTYMDRY